jgi:sec-independent protein translocase protein TatB
LFGNLNAWELLALALLALFIFGPERLPKVVGDAMRMLRGLRSMARNATNDLSRELGTEVRLEDLNPKTFIRNHILSDDEQRALRRPFEDLARDVQGIDQDVRRSTSDLRARPVADRRRTPDQPPAEGDGGRHRADPDAT